MPDWWKSKKISSELTRKAAIRANSLKIELATYNFPMGSGKGKKTLQT